MNFVVAQSYEEIVKLFPLFHKFFDKAETDYTEREFFSNLPMIVNEGVIGYVEHEGQPVAYGIMLKTRLLRDYALILQVYSERPFAIRHLLRAADTISSEWGVDRQIAFVGPDVAMYFAKHYKMTTKYFMMERMVEKAEEAVM